MTQITERRMNTRPYTADCPFTPKDVEPVPCRLLTCDGCHIRDEYNRQEDKRLADQFRSYCANRDNN